MGDSTILLALDVATATGFMHGDIERIPATPLEARHGLKPTGGTKSMGEGLSMGHFLFEWRKWLWNSIRGIGAGRVVYASTIFWQGKTSIYTARKLYSMATMVDLVCYEAKVPCRELNESAARKHFTGKDEGKAGAQQGCLDRGWPFGTPDEADAAALFDLGAALWRKDRSAL